MALHVLIIHQDVCRTHGLFTQAFKCKAAYKQGTKMYCCRSMYVDLNCLVLFAVCKTALT